jgi:hypothetical protein
MMDFQVKPSRLLFRIQQMEIFGETIRDNEMFFGGRKIFLSDGRILPKQKMALDFLILTSNSSLKPDDFLDN